MYLIAQMQEEQEIRWLKQASMKAKKLKSRNENMKYIIKLMQDELKKTKKHINSECRQPEFDYDKYINKILEWNPRKSLRFVTEIKNATKT